MARQPTIRYVCSNCAALAMSWSGRCPQCGEWNTLDEEAIIEAVSSSAKGKILRPKQIDEIQQIETKRLKTKIDEIDSVFGGGIVPGSVTLIAGQPGIGKSTLLLQVAYAIASNAKTLYVSAEESLEQIGLRASRLGIEDPLLELVTSNSADDIAETIRTGKYQLVIIDSIQTVSSSGIASATGSITQITNSTQRLSTAAKQTGTAIILVGHVTKEGSIAGPKVLEHAVDVVMQLEGDRFSGFKVLRSVKNRFGPTSEAGIFEMRESGLMPVDNPSAALLEERQVTDGSVVLATLEGSRPVLVEVQALVNPSNYGYPKRATSGYDLNRLNLLTAVLERRTKLRLSESDIYINIVGGIQIHEPAADLAICLAIGSAAKGLQLKKNAVVFGEIGLSGEIRHVLHADKRLNEALRLGFIGAIGPQSKDKKLSGLYTVPDIKTALNQFLEKD